MGCDDDGRLGPLTCIDNVPDRVGPGIERVAWLCRESLTDAGATHAWVVEFSRDGLQGEVGESLARLLEPAVRVSDVWVAGGGRYRSAWCPDRECCPPQGVPLPQVGSGRGAVSQANTYADRAGALALWRRALRDIGAGVPVNEGDVRELAVALRDVVVRDAIVIDIIPGHERVAERLCVDPSAPGVREALDSIIGSRRPRTPDLASLRCITALTLDVARVDPAGRCPGLTLAGLVYWWAGDAERARMHLEDALRVDGGYRLATLLLCAIEAGMEPGWKVAAQSTANRPRTARGHKKSA